MKILPASAQPITPPGMRKLPMGLETALAEEGYVTLVCFGFKENANGQYVLRIAAHSAIKTMSARSWGPTRQCMIEALDKLRETPLDDLTRRSL